MNAITKLDVLDLEHALERYDVGRLVRFWPAANGIENSNYFLRTEDDGREREFVLTIMEQPANAGSAYVPLLDRCVDAGLPVAEVVRNNQGEPTVQHEGKLVVLCRRLPGRHVYNPTLKQVAALGRFIARFHLENRDWNFPVPGHPRTPAWLAENARHVEEHLPWVSRSLLNDSVREVSSLLARQDVAMLPSGVIHGDLFRDNVLFNERGLTGVLDFHHAAHGYLLYDLAVAANDWCTDSTGLLNPDRTTELLRAYHAIRPLTSGEVQLFPAFALYAALAFWLSRLTVSVQCRQDVRSNNPAEFERIVAQHHAHFFYLDERLLD